MIWLNLTVKVMGNQRVPLQDVLWPTSTIVSEGNQAVDFVSHSRVPLIAALPCIPPPSFTPRLCVSLGISLKALADEALTNGHLAVGAEGRPLPFDAAGNLQQEKLFPHSVRAKRALA